MKSCTAAEGKVCRFSVLELEFLFLLPLWHKAEKSHKSKAPSERELAPKATEGECETFGFSALFSLAGSFRHACA